ncbi:MAG: AI-2E family transporter [Bacteroidales bacterium]|nr:AI-2E family transporter [Bacteroidales bacterium]
MKQKSISFHNTAYFLIVVVFGFLTLKHGKFFLAPLTFAILFTVMLQPVTEFFEKLIKRKIPSILLSLLAVIIPVGIIITLFSVQFTSIINNLPDITGNIVSGLETLLIWVRENLNLTESDIEENLPALINNSLGFIQKGITSSTTFLFNFLFTLLVTFFLLWYRNSFNNFMLIQTRPEKRDEMKEILIKVKKTIQGYLYGLLLVIAILAILNSVGLMIIGIDYAIFWGTLAALLAVIPYIGTTLGGTLPFLYAVATTGNWWQPAAVVGMYVIIQNLEGNIITPNVVGSSVSINPLIALLAIMLGGFVWGVSGIILAIPVVAIIKVFFEHNNRLKPVAFLMSNKVHKQDNAFWEEWDEDQYRMK